MPFKLAFRREAQQEHRAAVRWYESQREGLGDRYLNAIAMKLAEIQHFRHDLAKCGVKREERSCQSSLSQFTSVLSASPKSE